MRLAASAGVRSPGEARSRPLRRVGDEGELAHDERRAARVDQRAIEPTFRVLEDPQPATFSASRVGAGLGVAAGDPEEDEQALADSADDLSSDGHGRVDTDALDDGTHSRTTVPSCEGHAVPITGVVEAAQSPWPVLGVLLVRDGAITPAQLDAALAAKRETPKKRIGEILVEQGAATRSQIARVLAEQHELPFLELTALMIEPEAATLLPEQLAKRYSAIPVSIQGDAVRGRGRRPHEHHALGRPAARDRDVREGRRRAVGCDRLRNPEDVRRRGCPARRGRGGGYPKTVDDATKIDLNHESPAVVFVNRAIAKALDIGASDIHFTPQAKRLHVRARVDGVMREIASVSERPGHRRSRAA